MDFQRDSIRPLSNYETYLVVKQIHETNNERENFLLLSTDSSAA